VKHTSECIVEGFLYDPRAPQDRNLFLIYSYGEVVNNYKVFGRLNANNFPKEIPDILTTD